jgi:hypothetical protein
MQWVFCSCVSLPVSKLHINKYTALCYWALYPIKRQTSLSACYSLSDFGLWSRQRQNVKAVTVPILIAFAKFWKATLLFRCIPLYILYHKQTKTCHLARHFNVTYHSAACLVYHVASSCTSVVGTGLQHFHYSTTALQYYSTAALQYYSTAALQHCSTTTLQHCSTAALQHYSTRALQHYSTTALQHHSIRAL